MLTVSEALARAAQREPELAAYYEFHRAQFELQEKARSEIAATLELADSAALHARLSQGWPLLAFAQLPIEAERFAPLATAIARMMATYNPDLGQTWPQDAGEWSALAQKRFEENQVRSEERKSPLAAVTLAELVADAALKPYLMWAAEQVLPHLNLEQWRQPYCPVCGGAPDFALLEEEVGARRLVCSRCNSQWPYQRLGCPFCGTDDHAKIVYYPSDDEVYRLYVCQACRGYLKTLDLRRRGGQVMVDVERITTVAMDAAAQQEGYLASPIGQVTF